MLTLSKSTPLAAKAMIKIHRLPALATTVYQKCAQTVLKALRQGLTPKKMAQSLAVGAFIGTIPIPGITTALCSLTAARFRLNFATIQITNYAASPAQWLLLIPFIKIGSYLLPDASTQLSAIELITTFQQSPYHAIQNLWQILLGAVAAWFLICTPIAWAAYKFLHLYFNCKWDKSEQMK